MTNSLLRLLLIMCCAKAGYAIAKFNLFHHCDKKISMVGNAVKGALLFYQDVSTYSDSKDPCIVELRGWYDNRIAMHFRYFYLDRMKTSIEIRQGDDWIDARPIAGLPKILNSSTFDNLFQFFTSDGVGLFIAINKPSSRFNIKLFELALNVFHTGNCKSWEYSCANGWCIDEDIKCSGYFPCGDYSDCRTEVSGGLIAGIIVGSIVVASIVLAVGCYYVRRHWRRRMRERELTGNSRYSWSPPDTTQGDTYTDNAHGYRWNNNDHSMNNLFDDDNSPSLHQRNRHSPSLNRTDRHSPSLHRTNRHEPPNYNSVVGGNGDMGSRSNTNERQGPEPSTPSLGPEYRDPSLVPQPSAPSLGPQPSAPIMESNPNVPSEHVMNRIGASDLPSYYEVLENQDAYKLNLPGDRSAV